MNDQDKIFNELIKMTKTVSETKSHVQEYKKARKLHQVISDSMMDFAYNNKIDPNLVLNQLANQIHLSQFMLNLNNKLDQHIYGDLIMYPQYVKVQSLTEIYLEKHKFRKEEKILMLEAMKNSYVSFFEIISRDDLEAITTLKNIITKEVIKVVDFTLGAFNAGQDQYFYLRIISYQGINFQTGLAMHFEQNASIKNWIKQNRSALVNHKAGVITVKLFEFYRKHSYKDIVVR